MSNWIHGFYFDIQMYKNEKQPIEGDWPDVLVFTMFVYDTAEEAITDVKQQEKNLKMLGREMAEKCNEQVIKGLYDRFKS